MNCSKTILKLTLTFFIYIIPSSVIFAGIKFSNGDININNEILFTIKHNIPGTTSYRSLFKSTIKDGTAEVRPELLTCFPEQMELLNNGSIIQIRNRYGTGWYKINDSTFNWIETKNYIPEISQRTAPYLISPNGKWMCFIEKKTYATGNLVLKDVTSGKTVILNKNTRFSYNTVPAKWQNDSSILIYEKDGLIYFCNPNAIFKGIEVEETYRKIGPGTINSINWADNKYLVYIDSDILYKISGKELYTMGLYSGIIGKGTTIGRLPTQFDSSKDIFSVNKNTTGIVIIQGKKHFTLYSIKRNSCDYLEVITSRPYTNNEASFLESEIIWANEDSINEFNDPIPAVWLKTLPYNGKTPTVNVYKLNDKFNKLLSIEDSSLPSFSPNKSKCAFYSGTTTYIYDTSTWKRISEINGEKIISTVWQDNDNLFLGGEKTIKKWSLKDKSVTTFLLSQVTNSYWDTTNRILADAGNGRCYLYNNLTHTWSENGTSIEHKSITKNENYRVFCGETQNTNYENALYIRSLKGKPITKPVLSESTVKKDDNKKVALVFDAYDNTDGLAKILYELNSYNIKGTFFLNGEFIRRYPNETKQISNTNNECASMFFATVKLVSDDFIVDEDFIRKGLARNEDEFFQLTGKELALLWHSPYYIKSEKIIEAGKNAGYTYIDAIKHSFDSITLEDAISSPKNYYSSSELIDIYMEILNKNKSGIIPITVGISNGSRKSYVYDYLDLLLSALLDDGFKIVQAREI